MEKTVTITRAQILERYRPINPTTHKGIQGHALIIGGSYGKIGAVSLASKAALRTGCGLVTALVPKCGYNILQTTNPEVMVLTDVDENYITDIDFSIIPQAIAIGPGMGLNFKTQKTFHSFLKVNQIPLVIDADALNTLGINSPWFYILQAQSILTPHARELERLIGTWDSEEEKFGKAVDFSLKFNLILVLKGAPTFIVHGKKIYKNTTGNAALATAGSGDVLTGIITSLVAQSYSPIDAAIIGVYLHGLCADLKDDKTSTQSFIASDIIDNLGKSFLNLGI